MKQLIKTVIDAFQPTRCVSCGGITDDGEFLCDYCSEMLKPIDPLKRCKRCGLTKDKCVCKYRIYIFDGCIAPFVNDGIAQNITYAFKFHRKFTAADFLAGQMALCIKNEYRNVRFDCITCVPMHKAQLRKRGFNQSKVLAQKISGIIGVPYCDLLVCSGRNHSQHKIKDIKKRFQNVKGKYKAIKPVKSRTVLIIDDIMTSGATLDECAGILLRAGADRVYCATALRTEMKDKKKKSEENHGN